MAMFMFMGLRRCCKITMKKASALVLQFLLVGFASAGYAFHLRTIEKAEEEDFTFVLLRSPTDFPGLCRTVSS